MTVESIITRLPVLSFVVDFKVFLPMRSKIKKKTFACVSIILMMDIDVDILMEYMNFTRENCPCSSLL